MAGVAGRGEPAVGVDEPGRVGALDRADGARVDEPQLKAMFETSAEVLLVKAFGDYKRKNEAAWRR